MVPQHISPDMPVKDSKKYCISNAVDGTDEGTFWNENEEDVSVGKMKANDCKVGNSNTDC
jgi:hypothetical protein